MRNASTIYSQGLKSTSFLIIAINCPHALPQNTLPFQYLLRSRTQIVYLTELSLIEASKKIFFKVPSKAIAHFTNLYYIFSSESARENFHPHMCLMIGDTKPEFATSFLVSQTNSEIGILSYKSFRESK